MLHYIKDKSMDNTPRESGDEYVLTLEQLHERMLIEAMEIEQKLAEILEASTIRRRT